MAPTKGVKVKLDRVRTLRYTNTALAKLEDESGLTFPELGLRMKAGSIKAVAWGIWAGLIHESPELTVDQVVAMLDLSRLKEISAAFSGGLAQAFGKLTEPDASEKKEEAAT